MGWYWHTPNALSVCECQQNCGGRGKTEIPGTQVMQTVCYMPKHKPKDAKEVGPFYFKAVGSCERETIVNFKTLDTALGWDENWVIIFFKKFQGFFYWKKKKLHFILFSSWHSVSKQASFPSPWFILRGQVAPLPLKPSFVSSRDLEAGTGVHIPLFLLA